MAQLHDAFISYSHAGDGALAAALERGLERLAKPTFKLRAIDVFRDKSSLAANPGLWSGILEHLSNSKWFVLLASPGSAASTWCTREIAWWLEHRAAATLLIVLTDGEIFWDDAASDFDWARTTALGSALRGGFVEVPLYVDLRWARDENKLVLSNGTFRDMVLDLAATIRALPKDQLDGEDVRQLRRTRRLARLGVTAIALAGAIAVWQAVVATAQRHEAERQRDRALSRQLAAQANDLRVREPRLSLLLAAQALAAEPSGEAATSLLRALQAAPFDRIVEHPETFWSLAVSSDEQWAVVGDGMAATQRIALATGEVTRLMQSDSTSLTRSTLAVAVSADGKTVASGGFDQAITIWRNGRVIRKIPHGAHEGFIHDLAFSPDAAVLASVGSDGRLLIHDLASGSISKLINGWTPELSAVRISNDGSVLAVGGDGGFLELFRKANGSYRRVERPAAAIQDAATDPAWYGDAPSVQDLAFTADGSELFCAYYGRSVAIYDVATARLKDRIDATEHALVETMAIAPDGRRVVTGHVDGAVILWTRGYGRFNWTRQILYQHSAGVRNAAFLALTDGVLTTGFDGRLYVSTPSFLPPPIRERWRSEQPFDGAALLPGESRLTLSRSDRAEVVAAETGSILSVDSAGRAALDLPARTSQSRYQVASHGTRSAFVDERGRLVLEPKDSATASLELGTNVEKRALAAGFSPDGLTLYASYGDELRAWDTRTGTERVAARRIPATLATRMAISPDGRLVAVALGMSIDFGASGRRARSERVALLRADDLESVADDLETLAGSVQALFFSPDSRLLVMASPALTLWDLTSMQRLDEPVAIPSDAHVLGFAERDAMLLLSRPALGSILELDLEPSSWAQQACRLANRSLTSEEWAMYVSRDLPYRPACRDGRFDPGSTAPLQ